MKHSLDSSSLAEHLFELDSIRGLAALAVLMEHITSAFDWSLDTSWIRWPLINALFDGGAAVTIFFVLSGFVLSRPYVRRGETTPRSLATASFYTRRVTRVWLPWLAVFFLSLLIKVTVFTAPDTSPGISDWLAAYWHSETSLRDILLQCLYSMDSIEEAPLRLLPQDWSLGVEMRASLLMPLFILMVNRSSWLLLLSGAALLTTLKTGQLYFSFVIGVLLARHLDWIKAQAEKLSATQYWLAMGAGIALYQSRLLVSHMVPIDVPVEKIIWSITSIGSAAIIALSLRSSLVSRFLKRPAVLQIGKISYSIYLVQMIVLIWLVPTLLSELNHLGMTEPLPEFLVIVVMSITLTMTIAWFNHRWVEVPCIHLGRRLTNLAKRSPGLTQPSNP